MGTSLTGTTPQDTYDSLIKVTDNGPLTPSLKVLTDGLGNESTLSLSTTAASIAGTLAVTGNAAFDTSTLFVDAANNRVGVGTASPSLSLHLSDSAAALAYFESTNVNGAYVIWRNSGTSIGDVGSALGITGSGSASNFMIASRSGDMILGSSSAERMRITSDGNVGIGTSAPVTALDVNGEVSVAFNATYGVRFYNQDKNNWSFIGNSIATGGAAANLRIGDSTGEVMRITGGNVGIGTSAPAAKLHVLTGTTYGGLINTSVTAAGTTALSIGGFTDAAGGGNGSVVVASSHNHSATAQSDMVFYTHDGASLTEKARFLATGGLTFNGDTAAANALDDYEEGTWTMGVSFGGASVGVTYAANTGSYTKIGRQVTVNGYLQLSSKGSSTGGATITGLPFTVKPTDSFYSSVSIWMNVITFANQVQAYAEPNTTLIFLQEITEFGSVTSLNDADFANGSNLMISLTYFV